MDTETKNKHLLTHITRFQQLLEHYQPSDESIATLRATRLVLLVGPTAAGRNTLINILTTTGRYHYMVSDTTRAKRVNNGMLERDGVEYWFKSEEAFIDGLEQGGYIEAAIIHQQQVSGVNSDELKRAHDSGMIAMKEIEGIHGGETYHKLSPEALFIFLLPPDFDTWMQRLRARGEMPEAELRRRLESAREEMTDALKGEYYQFVINNEIHEAASAVDELANGRMPDSDKQMHGRNHAEQLIIDVQLYLAV